MYFVGAAHVGAVWRVAFVMMVLEDAWGFDAYLCEPSARSLVSHIWPTLLLLSRIWTVTRPAARAA